MRSFAPILMLFVFIFDESAFAQTQGPYYPSTTENQPLATCGSCVGSIWGNTSNVAAADGQCSEVTLKPYLFCFQSQCYRSRYLTCYNFGFSIPSNAVIDGIMMLVNGKSNYYATVMDCTIVLMLNNAPAGTNLATGNDWDTTLNMRVYGSPTELWGLNLTPSDINSAVFGTYIKVYNPTTATPKVYVDEVRMVVYYSIGTATYSQVSSPGTFRARFDPVEKNIDVSFLPDELAGQAQLRVSDVNGKTCFIKNIDFTPGSLDLEKISVPGLEQGIYFCTLVTPAHRYSSKLVLTE